MNDFPLIPGYSLFNVFPTDSTIRWSLILIKKGKIRLNCPFLNVTFFSKILPAYFKNFMIASIIPALDEYYFCWGVVHFPQAA